MATNNSDLDTLYHSISIISGSGSWSLHDFCFDLLAHSLPCWDFVCSVNAAPVTAQLGPGGPIEVSTSPGCWLPMSSALTVDCYVIILLRIKFMICLLFVYILCKPIVIMTLAVILKGCYYQVLWYLLIAWIRYSHGMLQSGSLISSDCLNQSSVIAPPAKAYTSWCTSTVLR